MSSPMLQRTGKHLACKDPENNEHWRWNFLKASNAEEAGTPCSFFFACSDPNVRHRFSSSEFIASSWPVSCASAVDRSSAHRDAASSVVVLDRGSSIPRGRDELQFARPVPEDVEYINKNIFVNVRMSLLDVEGGCARSPFLQGRTVWQSQGRPGLVVTLVTLRWHLWVDEWSSRT